MLNLRWRLQNVLKRLTLSNICGMKTVLQKCCFYIIFGIKGCAIKELVVLGVIFLKAIGRVTLQFTRLIYSRWRGLEPEASLC